MRDSISNVPRGSSDARPTRPRFAQAPHTWKHRCGRAVTILTTSHGERLSIEVDVRECDIRAKQACDLGFF